MRAWQNRSEKSRQRFSISKKDFQRIGQRLGQKQSNDQTLVRKNTRKRLANKTQVCTTNWKGTQETGECIYTEEAIRHRCRRLGQGS